MLALGPVGLALPLIALGLGGCGARSGLLAANLDGAATGRDAPGGDAGECAGSPATAVTLASFTGTNAEPVALILAPPHAYVGVFQLSEIDRVPLVGGEPVRTSISSYLGGPLASDVGHLFYPRSAPNVGRLGVNSYDLATGHSSELASPTFPTLPLTEAVVNGLAGAGDGQPGACWLLTRSLASGTQHETMLVRWDGAALASILIAPLHLHDLHVGAHQAVARSAKAIYALPLAGGEPLQLAATLSAKAAVLAVHGDLAFLTLDGASILRVDLVTGAQTTLVADVTLERCGYCAEPAAWADESSLYFVDGALGGVGTTIRRVPTRGGAAEPIWSHDSSVVAAMAGDRCNLYWLAALSSGPPVLLAQRR